MIDPISLYLVGCAVISIISIAVIARCEKAYLIGKRLLDAAGSEDDAELSIADARALRRLREADRAQRETNERTAAEFRKLGMTYFGPGEYKFPAGDRPNNILQFRITQGGKPLHFDDKGAA